MTSGLSLQIKNKARELGLDICGIARPRVMEKNRDVLKDWVEAGMNDKMGYLSRNTERRADPSLHLNDVKSVIVTGMSYNAPNLQREPGVPVISRYAYGRRYQDVITEKLTSLLQFINETTPAEGKIVVDSAPFFEKPWAVEAGLGWQGRHSIVINREIGSFFFIGILMVSIELEYDTPSASDHCGSCRACIDKCPTGAINDNRTIDTRKCISNLTIENREPVSPEVARKFGNRVYGCDICQEVCPWNARAPFKNHSEFTISESVASMTKEDWLSLTEDDFKTLFADGPIGRLKYPTFLSNIKSVLLQNV